MNQLQTHNILKVHKGLVTNHNQSALKVSEGTQPNHNQTVLKVRKGMQINHNETMLKLGGEGRERFSRSLKVRKQSIILIFLVMLLVSCSPLAGNTSSPSTTVSSTQIPSSGTEGTETTWKTYTNAEAGFSIQYPADWQEQDLPDENAGQMHRIALKGTEGGIELVWGVGLGGACPEGYQPIAVAQGTVPACHTQRDDGTDLWSLAPPTIGDTNFGGFVYTNDTTAKSREVVLQVLSTLSLP